MPAPKGHAPYNVNGEGGRKKVFTPEFLDKEADALVEWMEKKGNIFIEDFCHERGYDDSRVSEWERNNERFGSAYKRFKMLQKTHLFKGGLSKKYSQPMCALILSHSHNIVARTEQRISGDASNPLSIVLSDIDGKTKDLIEDDI